MRTRHHIGRICRDHECYLVESQGICRRANRGTGGHHVVDKNKPAGDRPSVGEAGRGKGMVATGPASIVDRGGQRINQRHTEVTSQSPPQLAGRVDPVRNLAGPRPRHGHDGQRRDPGSDDLHHQIGVCGQTPVLEPVYQVTGRAYMLEGSDQTDPTVEDPLRSRSQVSSTTTADVTRARRETRLTKHLCQR